MTPRWPVHPAPIPGEALTSWLARIAHKYGISADILASDLGYAIGRDDDLDLAPPAGFAEKVADRTGVAVADIRAMTISGHTPWLLDQLEPGPDAFSTYIRQLSVLLPKGARPPRTVTSWRPWIPTADARDHRACPHCVLATTPPHPHQLMWALPVMLSCPIHHCRLELHDGVPGYYFSWTESSSPIESRPATAAIELMDGRTWQALTTGHVDLPRRRIHAGIWFRLLRTVIDDLGATMADCAVAEQRLIREVWQRAGHPVRAGQYAWRPYEALTAERRERTLEAAAAAMHAMESRTLVSRTEGAGLFLPEPDVVIDSGYSRPTPATPAVADRWRDLAESLEAAVEDARHNPQSARQLFYLATYHCRNNEDKLCEVRETFAALGIPLDNLPIHTTS